mgnify:CR=1 FL=1
MISLIIPCFNEEESLPLFYPEATSVLQKMNCDYELIFVNDGSRDRTLAILKELSEKDPHVIYLSFSRNFGKEAAMYAGFCNARGDYVAVMDADLQDPPSLLPEMLEKLESGEYDSVATRRVSRDGEPPIRSFFARKFYQLINKISDADIVDGARDFRLMKRSMVDAIVSMSEYNRFSKGIFGWIGFKTLWLPYKNIERVAGETKWNFWKLFKYAISGIINFSQAPLTIASWFGTSMTGVSFLALIVIVLRKLIFDDPVDGWASIICVIIFIGGLQLFCLGIMGQYIAKTYMEVKNRPHYIIAESNKKDFFSYTLIFGSLLCRQLYHLIFVVQRGRFFFYITGFINRVDVIDTRMASKYSSSRTSLSITRCTLFSLSKISPIRLNDPGVMLRYSSICSPSAKESLAVPICLDRNFVLNGFSPGISKR